MKSVFLILLALSSLSCYGQQDGYIGFNKLSAAISDFELFQFNPLPNSDFFNEYYLGIRAKGNFDVVATEPGKVLKISQYEDFPKMYKVVVEHDPHFTSIYILTSPRIRTQQELQKGEIIGESLRIARTQYYYTSYALLYDGQYVLPELVRLARSFTGRMDEIVSLSKELVSRKQESEPVSTISFFKGNFVVSLKTRRENLNNRFGHRKDLWENQLHHYEFDIYTSNDFELAFLDNLEKVVSVKTISKEVRLNNEITTGMSYHEAMDKYGRPSNFILRERSSNLISDNCDLLIDRGYLNENAIQSMQYDVVSEEYDYILSIHFDDGRIAYFEVGMLLP